MARFVGRHDELELLQRRFAMAAQGQGHVVGIVGEAGIGKSRLLFEFRQSQRGKTITYLEGRCFSYGSAIPYFPVLDILRRNFGIIETDHSEVVTEKVRTGLGQIDMDRKSGLPIFSNCSA